jgi:hypothetical protein
MSGILEKLRITYRPMRLAVVGCGGLMKLLVETPTLCIEERKYVLGVILDEFLGLPWQWAPSPDNDVHIHLSGADGEIRLPDLFFSQIDHEWPTVKALPALPLGTWDTRELAAGITLTDPVVPMIYGVARTAVRQTSDQPGLTIDLPIDIFGSAFFMLSRYEEIVIPARDNHNRFPATASLAYQAGFLDRPIVDEYVEILWAAFQCLWPALVRKARKARTVVSCDVDLPFDFTGTLKSTVYRFGGDILKRRSPALGLNNLVGNWQAWRGNNPTDRYRAAIDWIMDVNEQAGRSVAFYFIPENTDPIFDSRFDLDQPRMRALLRDIHTRGHEIGLHPGYNTYCHPDAMARSIATLRRVLEEEEIDQAQLGGRQHLLRWESATTPRLWEDNGMDYDTTLSYADQPGFRCGTCHEYQLYDVEERRPLRLRERPLIVMECTIIAKRYLGMGYSDAALSLMQNYRDTCYHFGGDFTLLWHNSHLQSADDQRFYQMLTT